MEKRWVAGWEKIVENGVRMVESGGSVAGVDVVGFLEVLAAAGVAAGVGSGMMPNGLGVVGVGGMVIVVRVGFVVDAPVDVVVGNWDLVGLAIKSPKSSPKSSSLATVLDCWKSLVSMRDSNVLLLLWRSSLEEFLEVGGIANVKALLFGAWVEIDNDLLNPFPLSCRALDGKVGVFSGELEASAKSPKSSSTSSSCCGN